MGTYEYNPVNEGGVKEGGGGEGRLERACGVDAVRVSHSDQIRRVPSAKIRGAGYESPSMPPREIIIVRDR